MKPLLAVAFLIFCGWKIFTSQSVSLGPGVMVEDTPIQVMIDSPEHFIHGQYTITPLASYSIKAKVLSREDYKFDRLSDLSPMDLAVGWGKMSDEAVLEKIDISQSVRFYHWRVDEFPIPRKEIETYSANIHLIPADDNIKSRMNSTKQGEIIELQGKLVKIEASDGWKWASSLTRDDINAGACELIWVEDFQLVNL